MRTTMRLSVAAVALLLAAAVLSVAVPALPTSRETSPTAPPTDAEDEPTSAIELLADEFDPRELRVAPGQEVSVVVRNLDPYPHTFTIDALGVDEFIGPEAERLVRFRAPTGQTADAGRFRITCRVTGHEGMLATLIVA